MLTPHTTWLVSTSFMWRTTAWSLLQASFAISHANAQDFYFLSIGGAECAPPLMRHMFHVKSFEAVLEDALQRDIL